MMDSTITDSFLGLSPAFTSFISSPTPPAHDFTFAQLIDTPNTPSLSFPQASQEYPTTLMSPELMQLFGQSDLNVRVPQFMVAHDMASNQFCLSFPPSEFSAPASLQQPQQYITNPHLDIKCEPTDAAPWLTYNNLLQEVLSHPLPFQNSLASITPRDTNVQCTPVPQHIQITTTPSPSPSSFSQPSQEIKQDTPQSTSLQTIHQRLLQRLRKSQVDGNGSHAEEKMEGEERGMIGEQTQMVISESSKKADSTFNKFLELFSYYFNTQKTASPLACSAALYLGQVGFELQKRYEAYSRFVKCGVLEEILLSFTRASNLRKLGIKSYEEFLRAEVSELRRIKDPERYLNRRMQVFQSYEPEELEGVYLSFDALYLLAKKPPSFRKEWLEEGKIRIVHICEIHDAWRSSPLNKTKRSRSPTELEEGDGCSAPTPKVLKADA